MRLVCCMVYVCTGKRMDPISRIRHREGFTPMTIGPDLRKAPGRGLSVSAPNLSAC